MHLILSSFLTKLLDPNGLAGHPAMTRHKLCAGVYTSSPVALTQAALSLHMHAAQLGPGGGGGGGIVDGLDGSVVFWTRSRISGLLGSTPGIRRPSQLHLLYLMPIANPAVTRYHRQCPIIFQDRYKSNLGHSAYGELEIYNTFTDTQDVNILCRSLMARHTQPGNGSRMHPSRQAQLLLSHLETKQEAMTRKKPTRRTFQEQTDPKIRPLLSSRLLASPRSSAGCLHIPRNCHAMPLFPRLNQDSFSSGKPGTRRTFRDARHLAEGIRQSESIWCMPKINRPKGCAVVSNGVDAAKRTRRMASKCLDGKEPTTSQALGLDQWINGSERELHSTQGKEPWSSALTCRSRTGAVQTVVAPTPSSPIDDRHLPFSLAPIRKEAPVSSVSLLSGSSHSSLTSVNFHVVGLQTLTAATSQKCESHILTCQHPTTDAYLRIGTNLLPSPTPARRSTFSSFATWVFQSVSVANKQKNTAWNTVSIYAPTAFDQDTFLVLKRFGRKRTRYSDAAVTPKQSSYDDAGLLLSVPGSVRKTRLAGLYIQQLSRHLASHSVIAKYFLEPDKQRWLCYLLGAKKIKNREAVDRDTVAHCSPYEATLDFRLSKSHLGSGHRPESRLSVKGYKTTFPARENALPMLSNLRGTPSRSIALATLSRSRCMVTEGVFPPSISYALFPTSELCATSAGQSFSTPYLIVAGCKYLIICIIERFGSVGHDARRNGLPVSITFQCQSELRGSQSRCEICSIPRIKRRRCALVHREEHCLVSNLSLYAWDSHFRSSDKAPSAPAEFSFTDNPIIYLSRSDFVARQPDIRIAAVHVAKTWHLWLLASIVERVAWFVRLICRLGFKSNDTIDVDRQWQYTFAAKTKD
ncbi:uncharacterized protein CLUP02_13527 [Colletotrichum lupini]|uniref:Uncharacterized protein n=1 Tax=Colletotrichum lupini TaxID=145971 RepID=A0A9Q8T2V0_9PEZI|nr:uncharacterized protein CLUP02_13527 [Colletotrichum lupini]UQC88005.1 hypothetical protein CLUP02_13527 [Colletotrichum lupini]